MNEYERDIKLLNNTIENLEQNLLENKNKTPEKTEKDEIGFVLEQLSLIILSKVNFM